MTRRPITSPSTLEQEDRLKLLAAQKATALRASAALNKPISSVQIRARKLGLPSGSSRDEGQNSRAYCGSRKGISKAIAD